MSEKWFRIALLDGDVTRLAIAPGEHLGAAIAAAQKATRHDDAWPIAAEPAIPDEVPLGGSVGKGVVVEKEGPSDLPGFRWPSGIVPSLAGARELGMPVTGHHRSRHGAVHAIEVATDGERLIELFMEIVEELPTADNVEVRVTGQHDHEGRTEVWLSPRLADVRRAIRFLDDHDVELLGNGYVEVAVYLRKQKSTLRMTEHKTLLWLSEDDALADTFVGWMNARDLPARDEMPLVSSVEHHHWRPAKTRTRKKLLQHLTRARLRRVDSWADAA